MKNPLKLVTLYDTTRHEYMLYRHNLTEDEANKAVRELAAQLFGLVILDQRSKHSVANPEECPACRRVVETPRTLNRDQNSRGGTNDSKETYRTGSGPATD